MVGTKNGELQGLQSRTMLLPYSSLSSTSHKIQFGTCPISCSGAANFLVDLQQYILDGGALLRHIPWSRGTTNNQVFEQYTTYVIRKYARAVVFDARGLMVTVHAVRHQGLR